MPDFSAAENYLETWTPTLIQMPKYKAHILLFALTIIKAIYWGTFLKLNEIPFVLYFNGMY
jgi:hypothetical protein